MCTAVSGPEDCKQGLARAAFIGPVFQTATDTLIFLVYCLVLTSEVKLYK